MTWKRTLSTVMVAGTLGMTTWVAGATPATAAPAAPETTTASAPDNTTPATLDRAEATAPIDVSTGAAAPDAQAKVDPDAKGAKVDSEKERLATTTADAVRLPATTKGTVQVAEASASTGEVAVVGATWPAGQKVDAFVRTSTDGTWGAWEPMATDSATETTTSKTTTAAKTAGTEPYVVLAKETVQVATVSPTPVAVTLSASTTAITTSDTKPFVTPGPKPVIRTRADWGANESLVSNSYTYARVTGAMIHHTAGTNGYTADAVPGILRGIQSYHVNGRGWNDIAYNVLVDRFGRAWEGRGGGLTRAVQGGHGLGITNARVFGISAMGNFETVPAPDVMLDTMERVIAWKFEMHGVQVTDTTYGSGGTLNAISGHMDEANKACPGKYIYSRFPEIKRKVTSYMSLYRTPRASDHDLTGDKQADAVSQNGGAVDILQPTVSVLRSGSLSATFQSVTGSGWLNARTFNLGDADRTGYDDLMRIQADGNIFAYPLVATGWRTRISIPRPEWLKATALLTGWDQSGDGIPDVVSRDTAGNLWRHDGDGKFGFAPGVLIGKGWAGFDLLTQVPNYIDGKPVVIGRAATTGESSAYYLTPTGSSRWALGTVLKGYKSAYGVADMSADGRGDLMAVSSRNGLHLMAANGTGGLVAAVGSTFLPDHVQLMPGSKPGLKQLIQIIQPDGLLVRYTTVAVPGQVSSPAPIRVLNLPATPRRVVPVGDWNSDGRPDLLVHNGDGTADVRLQASDGTYAATGIRQPGNWSVVDEIIAAPNHGGEGLPAVVTFDKDNGRLALVTGNGQGGVAWETYLGTFTNYAGFVATGPLDVDSAPDLLGLRKDGATILIHGDGTGRVDEGVNIGLTWTKYQRILGGSDTNFDGFRDLIAVGTDGRTWVLPGLSGGRFGTPTLRPLTVASVQRIA